MQCLISESGRIWASGHALERMDELGVPLDMVLETIVRPTVTWPARDGRVHLGGSRIIVVLAPDTRTVVTVKLRTSAHYTHGVHTLTNLPTAA